MEPIYGQSGQVVGWLSEDRLVALNGRTVGRLYDDAVHREDGSHIGYFNEGVFRDNRGDTVAFIDGASGGPMKPMKHVRPVQPVQHVQPVRAVRHVRNVRAVRSLSWSPNSFDQYLGL